MAQRLPKLVLNAGVGRVGSSDRPQVVQRGFQVAFLPQSHPQVQMGRHAVWLQGQRLLKHLHRLDKIATLGQHGAQIGVGPPVFGIQGDRLSEFGDGAWKIGLFREGDPQPIVRLRGPRSNLHGALELFQRARVVVPLPIRQAQRDMKFGIRGIALDGRLELAHGGGSFLRLLRPSGHSTTEHEHKKDERPSSR